MRQKRKLGRKLLGFLLTLAMVVGLIPGMSLTAFASESYQIWIGGTQVTSENAANVLGDGTVSFNATTKTLTLNGANITGGHFTGADENGAAIYADGQELTICVEGDSTVTGPETSHYSGRVSGICAKKLVITGDKELNVKGGKATGTDGRSDGIWINSGGLLTIQENVSMTVASGPANYGNAIMGPYYDPFVKNAVPGIGWTDSAGTVGLNIITLGSTPSHA